MLQKIKRFFGAKSAGFYCSLAALVLLVVGVIVFSALANVSVEATETPSVVIAMAVVAIVLCAFTAFRDYFKIPSLLAFIFSLVTFASFIKGRVSYVAFYFSGDVMDTGLSPLFVVSFILMLLAVIASAMAICFKQEKISIKEDIK